MKCVYFFFLFTAIPQNALLLPSLRLAFIWWVNWKQLTILLKILKCTARDQKSDIANYTYWVWFSSEKGDRQETLCHSVESGETNKRVFITSSCRCLPGSYVSRDSGWTEPYHSNTPFFSVFSCWTEPYHSNTPFFSCLCRTLWCFQDL